MSVGTQSDLDYRTGKSSSVRDGVPTQPSTTVPRAGNDQPDGGRIVSVLTAAVQWLPPIAVLSLLAGIGWYGHHHEWKLPSFASISSTAVSTAPAWCDSHGVPEDACIVCDPSLIEPAPKLEYCKIHGVHGCVLERPELAQTKAIVIPTPDDLVRADNALSLMQRPENIPIGSSAGSRIQFASIDAMNKAGVDVEPVTRDQIVESIQAAGEIRYDATRTAAVSPSADGVVRRILVEVGDWVRKGDPLAVVDSQAIGQHKTELITALAEEELAQQTVTRLQPLAGKAVSGKRFLEARHDLQHAKTLAERAVAALTNLGIGVDLSGLRQMSEVEAQASIRSLGVHGDGKIQTSSNEIAVVSPIEGRVVDLPATIGEVVERGNTLFRVVDPRRVWLDLRVPAEQASLVQKGQLVRYEPDGLASIRDGEVTWISTDVDPQTRTVRIRAELDNADVMLRNESFGRGEIVLRSADDAIVVPEEALQWDGSSHLVFVRDARFFEKDRPKFFIARSVRPGVHVDGKVEMIAGVLPGEVIATKGSDVLRAQLLRSNLGAGCTCGH